MHNCQLECNYQNPAQYVCIPQLDYANHCCIFFFFFCGGGAVGGG